MVVVPDDVAATRVRPLEVDEDDVVGGRGGGAVVAEAVGDAHGIAGSDGAGGEVHAHERGLEAGIDAGVQLVTLLGLR